MVGISESFQQIATYHFPSYNEVKKWADSFVLDLHKNQVVALSGNLGAGKTSFVQAVLSSLQKEKISATSPTFSYLHTYEISPWPIYHFDLYRMQTERDFLSLGFEEYLANDGVCFIEWPEKILSLLPTNSLYLVWSFFKPGRKVTLYQKIK